ncbi:uncharacterized protein BDV14DRAFT_162937 [Aspergillus stella-maris]|uniref:uncharacterized protein n=1 Tax=Aspergillus stella-maris TaxID=1810926 RepID=UPI003CCD1573
MLTRGQQAQVGARWKRLYLGLTAVVIGAKSDSSKRSPISTIEDSRRACRCDLGPQGEAILQRTELVHRPD